MTMVTRFVRRRQVIVLSGFLVLVLAFADRLFAQANADWTEPFPPFMTGAAYMVMDADVAVVESGGKADFHYGHDPSSLYPPTKRNKTFEANWRNRKPRPLRAHVGNDDVPSMRPEIGEA